jgi:hypothetical protein
MFFSILWVPFHLVNGATLLLNYYLMFFEKEFSVFENYVKNQFTGLM